MADRQPFWKWHCWKSKGFFPYTQVICYWGLDLIFNAKLKLESGNWKIQHGCQAAIWQWHNWQSIGLGHRHKKTCIWNLKLNIQSNLELRSRNHVKYRFEIQKKTNMAARRQFWKWHRWKSIDFFSYTQVMCQWSLDLILKAILK